MGQDKILEAYEDAHSAFQSKRALEESDERLTYYLWGLSNQRNTNDGTQHRDVMRALTINSVLMQRHIDRLERRGGVVQKVVIALTVAAIVTGALQLWIAVRAEHRAAPFSFSSK